MATKELAGDTSKHRFLVGAILFCVTAGGDYFLGLFVWYVLLSIYFEQLYM
jgi:hypothetical protein